MLVGIFHIYFGHVGLIARRTLDIQVGKPCVAIIKYTEMSQMKVCIVRRDEDASYHIQLLILSGADQECLISDDYIQMI